MKQNEEKKEEEGESGVGGVVCLSVFLFLLLVMLLFDRGQQLAGRTAPIWKRLKQENPFIRHSLLRDSNLLALGGYFDD